MRDGDKQTGQKQGQIESVGNREGIYIILKIQLGSTERGKGENYFLLRINSIFSQTIHCEDKINTFANIQNS